MAADQPPYWPAMTLDTFRLEDRLSVAEGRVAMSGVQALLRVLVDQRRLDRRAGLHTAGLLSGYRGSPLGGIDLLFERNGAVMAEHDIEYISGLNEDLAATVVWGSQMIGTHDRPRYDGVIGMWYGKSPGVDRSGDALRHANFAGAARHGGVLCVAGDDPGAKSSTLPSASEVALADLAMPVLYPGDVQDVIDLGLFGYALSRFCGLWVGYKINTDVADAYATVEVGPDRVSVSTPDFEIDGRPWRPEVDNRLINPWSVAREAEVFGARLDAAQAFVRHNRVDTIAGRPGAWLGIVAAGKAYADVVEALAALGVDSPADLGIRLFKPAAISPLHRRTVAEFADGLEEILVVEEKRPFLETQLRDLLYGGASQPRIVGKRDEADRPQLPLNGALEASLIEPVLRARLEQRVDPDRLARPRRRIEVASDGAPLPGRTPFFCSGCPHNRSTTLPDGSTAGGGIGCHGMALLIPSRATDGITHMGGEGAQWVGAAPFVDEPHRFQNLGDGTFFHSGSLAIRQAVSAGTSVTYKILYNGVVAMTGGQEAAGEMPVPELTRLLEAEGVARTVVVTDDPDKYPADARFAPGTKVWHRDRLDEAQRLLREVDGVTVLIYDQACAAELRRSRRRGSAETPAQRVFINEAVCEGCGHCGAISNCLSVHPVETPFGSKTQIHQESCNFDFSCIDGNCPAFVTVVPGRRERQDRTFPSPEVPEPAGRVAEANILMVGIGGTGVVTANQLLATAAMIDGKHASSLDQTGLSQKAGPVVSNLKITEQPASESNRVGVGAADAYLAFDLLTGSNPKNLSRAHPDRTTAVISTGRIPTGSMVLRAGMDFPELDRFRAAIDPMTRADANVWVDADHLARHLFGSQAAANVIVIGAAYQRGLLPVSAAAVGAAIDLNGVQPDMNHSAFAVGRLAAHDPQAAAALVPPAPRPVETSPEVPPALAERSPRLHEAVDRWSRHLTGYQSAKLARSHLDVVTAVSAAERAIADSDDLAVAVAENLGKLLAYKDEYEVARLHRDAGFHARIERQFGEGAAVTYLLRPPTLEQVGLRSKIRVPAWLARPTFAALASARRVRGTWLDPFGHSAERRMERRLIVEYLAVVDELVQTLRADNLALAVEIASLPDLIRGYSTIKQAAVERYSLDLTRLLDRYRSG